MNKEIIEKYKKYGIDVEKAIETLSKTRISIQCWQLDDVNGFENNKELTGGIASTGNYEGKARNFNELKEDLNVVLDNLVGCFNINVHANYQTDKIVDRSDITREQYSSWIDYAKEKNIGLDFNPTIFSSPMLVDGLSLSSPYENVRKYWIKHCINSIKVSEAFGKELGVKSLCNIWIPDGLKDSPADRIGPRKRLMESLDEILEYKYNKSFVDISVESKVFGIGVESYTVGSHEFYMNYAKTRDILYLLDMGHFHPTESVADKISSLLLYNDGLALHVSRGVRWDSDHVVRLTDELQDVADELVKCNSLEKTHIGLDFFDGSINRICALIIGTRNMQKAILRALLTPWDKLKELQNNGDHTLLLAMQENVKNLPWGEVWNEFLIRNGKLDDDWYTGVKRYEQEVMMKRK